MESLWPVLFLLIRTGEGSFANRAVLTARAWQHCHPSRLQKPLRHPCQKPSDLFVCYHREKVISETEAATEPARLLPRICKSFWRDMSPSVFAPPKLCISVSQLLVLEISRDPSGMKGTCLLLGKAVAGMMRPSISILGHPQTRQSAAEQDSELLGYHIITCITS